VSRLRDREILAAAGTPSVLLLNLWNRMMTSVNTSKPASMITSKPANEAEPRT
jgi:hypothetical protein